MVRHLRRRHPVQRRASYVLPAALTPALAPLSARTHAAQLALAALAVFVCRAAYATSFFVNDASTVGDVAFPGCAAMGPGVSSSCGSCAQPCLTLQSAYSTLPLSA